MAAVRKNSLEAYGIKIPKPANSVDNPFGLKDFSKVLDKKFGTSAFSSKVFDNSLNRLKSDNVFISATKTDTGNPFATPINNSIKIKTESSHAASIYDNSTNNMSMAGSIFGSSVDVGASDFAIGGTLFGGGQNDSIFNLCS